MTYRVIEVDGTQVSEHEDIFTALAEMKKQNGRMLWRGEVKLATAVPFYWWFEPTGRVAA